MSREQSQFVKRVRLLFELRARVRRRREIDSNRFELVLVNVVGHISLSFVGLGTLGTFAGCRLQSVTSLFTNQLENVPNLPNFVISFANRQGLVGLNTRLELKCLAKNVHHSFFL